MVGYCMLAQPALHTLGLELEDFTSKETGRGYGVPSTSQTPGTSLL